MMPERFSETSLTLPDECNQADWIKAGLAIQQMAVSSPWWLGDWLLFGKKYGEKLNGFIDQRLGEEAIQQRMRCSRYWHKNDRNPAVSWSIHYMIGSAGLEPMLACTILAMAAEQKWTK